MTHADNTPHLRAAAQARHDRALQRAHDAVRLLDRQGQPITFTAVAATAHVSRSWLYRQPDLRAAISSHRHATAGVAVPAAQRASTESNNARLDTLRLEIERLRAENATLRDHVARALGQRRAHPEHLTQQHVPDTHAQQAHHPALPRSR
jgi:hypothetical protein